MIIGIILAILAAAALIVELTTITFYLIAVAVALALGSAVALAGAPPVWAFTVVALTTALGLPIAHEIRKRIMTPTAESLRLSEDNVNHLVRVETVSPEGLRVSYRGSSWAASLHTDYKGPAIRIGDILRIVGRNGSDLILGAPEPPDVTQK